MTHKFTGAPCREEPPMWESTDPIEHAWAREICRTKCDHMAACLAELKAQLASPHHTPTGTWAGRLFNEKGHVENPRGPGRPRKKTAA